MRGRRGPAVAIALLCAALAAAGCGLGPGEEVGGVTLTVTRDYGAAQLSHPVVESVNESDTVMRVLDRNAEITTRYGGGFVQSIDGLEREDREGRSLDWLYYVNGVEATIGAAEYELSGGESIWWDYRDWTAAMAVPAVVGSWPQPFVGGYDGHEHPVKVECLIAAAGACGLVRERLEAEGVEPAAGEPEDAIRVLVGPWRLVERDQTAAKIAEGPDASGVFAEIEPRGGSFVISGLDEEGERARAFGPDAGLVAATRRYGAPPVWVVTGARREGVLAAARLLDPASLRNRYAVAVEGGEETPLPVR